jgi:hypothetical protein
MRSLIYRGTICIAGLFSFMPAFSQVAAVQLIVQVPSPDTVTKFVYVAGSFNYWHAGDTLYRMKKISEGQYSITLPVFEGINYLYKYTRGGWDKVELAANDSNITNRSFLSSARLLITDTVQKWKQPAAVIPVKNPRLEKINAMKDSVLKNLQPELTKMLDLLKLYVQNMLQEKPNERLHRRLDKKAIKKVNYAFTSITGLLYHAMALLTTEEKEMMQKKLKGPTAKDDFLNTFLNSFNAITEKK